MRWGERAILMLAAGYAAVVLAIVPDRIDGFASLLVTYLRTMFPLWLLVGLVILAVRLFVANRGRRTASAPAIVIGFAVARWRDDRLISVVAPPLIASLLLTAYNVFKQFILPAAGFGAGPGIAHLEHDLLGIDPWQLTHALMPSPYATKVLDLAYHAWFLPMTLGVVACSYLKPGSHLAIRYLFCFALLWIVQGSLLAYAFPAAGSCFYEYFQSDPDHYRAMTSLLAQQDASLRAGGAGGLAAVEYQAHLLKSYTSSQAMLGNGISAMPSLHNAMAALFACAAMHIDRRLGWFWAVYAAVIWIASIHLGWHYALDGIVSIPLTIAFWVGSGKLWRAAAWIPLAARDERQGFRRTGDADPLQPRRAPWQAAGTAGGAISDRNEAVGCGA